MRQCRNWKNKKRPGVHLKAAAHSSRPEDVQNFFAVELPKLPGCMAHGRTRRDAVRNAERAIAAWVPTAKEDGAEIPLPRGKLM